MLKYLTVFAFSFFCLSLSSCLNNPADLPQACIEAKKEQNIQKRVELYTKCIDSNKLKVDQLTNFYIYRGVSYDVLQQYPDSTSDLNKAMELQPDNGQVSITIGDIFNQSADYKKAITYYNKALEVNPNNPDTFHKRGTCYGRLLQYESAIDDFNKAIALKPNHSMAIYARGYTYGLIDRHKDAIEDFNTIIALKPTDQGSYFYRAISYEKSGRYQLAIDDYKKVIELNPDDPSNYNSLANLYISAEDHKFLNADQAVTLAQKATELTKGQVAGYLGTLAAAYATLGQFDKAIETQLKAITISEKKGESPLTEDYRKVLANYQEKQAALSTK